MRKHRAILTQLLFILLASFFAKATFGQYSPYVECLMHDLDISEGKEKMDILVNLGSAVSSFDNVLSGKYLAEAEALCDTLSEISAFEKAALYCRAQNFRNWGKMYDGDFYAAFSGSMKLDSLANILEKLEPDTLYDKSLNFKIGARTIRGAIFSDQKQYVKSEKEFGESLKLYAQKKDQRAVGSVYNNLGIVLMEQEKFEEAEIYMLKADSIFSEPNAREIDKAYSLLFLSDLYRQSRQWEKAKKRSFQNIEYSKKYIFSRAGMSTAFAAQAYLEVGEEELSDSLLAEAAILFKDIEEPALLSEYQTILAEMHEKRGEFEEALKIQKEVESYSDTIGSSLYSKELLELQDDYIAQKTKIKPDDFLSKNGGWIVAFLGLLMFFGWRYQNSKKEMPEIEIAQEAPRLEIAWKNDESEVQNADPFVERFMSVVSNRLEDGDLSVDAISEEMRISRVQLFKKIKAATGESPSAIIRQIRLETAERLLVSNTVTISEAAYRVGFSNPNSFSRAFKDHFGSSPKEYLRKVEG